MALMMGSAVFPILARARPKRREIVMMPRIFILTAATAILSGKILLITVSNASRAEIFSSLLEGAWTKQAINRVKSFKG